MTTWAGLTVVCLGEDCLSCLAFILPFCYFQTMKYVFKVQFVILECPGGAEFPCNNNGVCHNGIAGTGVCLCQPGFNGAACEFRDVNGTLKSWSKFNNKIFSTKG